ncbi:DUF58 domain-containing protein [Nocardiopsis sp. N85]|uniref:DUF58 domain-containing protein n=1 Tax=Nocardiopsis sp. N85 TaxID=3029400 RepID=UPI00237F6340|nr:DUF58 domain-containing protein [Nocardiopsis sp. N85]MDE3720247.1 DUF58 domain-containing protein [Nocardiopsis sp. N85]
MRPRRTLTARGVCLLLLGLIALVAGLVIGQRELVALGVLATAVPPLAALSVFGAAGRIAHSRLITPSRVRAGHDARVMVRVGNSSHAWPVTSVSIRDTLPTPLGHEPRYSLGLLGPRGVRDLAYLVRPAVRGNYPLGPLWVSVTDPLGCVRVEQRPSAPDHLLVTPATVPLGRVGTADGSQGDDSPRRSTSGIGEQDPVPREYRYGDELRRVHWRSTAKHGELMVRRDEQHRREYGTILLDTRRRAHAGTGAAHSLETAVSAAASIALHLLDQGHEVRLHTERGRMPVTAPSALLDGLAVIEPSDATAPPLGASAPASSASLTVAVLGAVEAEEAAVLARTGGGHRVAVLCAGAAWPSPDALRGVGEILSTGGWRVVRLSSIAELPPLWRDAAPLGKVPR